MNINEIQDLIKLVSKSSITEVEIERKDFKVTIKSDPDSKKKKGQLDQPVVQTVPVMSAMHQIPVAQQVQVAQPVAAAPVAPVADKSAAEATPDDKYVTVNSPMIGTFYRSTSPDKPPFVGVGDSIEPGKVICIVEAMKLFNEIEAEVSGKIIKVLVDDASPIEYDQPLFLIDPA